MDLSKSKINKNKNYKDSQGESMNMMRAAPLERCTTCLCGQCSVSEVSKVHALNSALDHAYSVFGVGVVFFDSKQYLTHLNELARVKLKLPTDFILMGGDLISECFNQQSQIELRSSIDQLINNKGANEINLNLTIKEEKNTVMLQRLEKTAFGIDVPGVVMFIFESNLNNDKSSADVARIFGLTKAEARLTLAITNGMTATEYSSEHGISINTAYSQIKAILAKTGTQRQAELIKLVLEHSPSLERRKSKMSIVAERRVS
jgi:DNA-binding CsgD family transcriptional regulator